MDEPPQEDPPAKVALVTNSGSSPDDSNRHGETSVPDVAFSQNAMHRPGVVNSQPSGSIGRGHLHARGTGGVITAVESFTRERCATPHLNTHTARDALPTDAQPLKAKPITTRARKSEAKRRHHGGHHGRRRSTDSSDSNATNVTNSTSISSSPTNTSSSESWITSRITVLLGVILLYTLGWGYLYTKAFHEAPHLVRGAVLYLIGWIVAGSFIVATFTANLSEGEEILFLSLAAFVPLTLVVGIVFLLWKEPLKFKAGVVAVGGIMVPLLICLPLYQFSSNAAITADESHAEETFIVLSVVVPCAMVSWLGFNWYMERVHKGIHTGVLLLYVTLVFVPCFTCFPVAFNYTFVRTVLTDEDKGVAAVFWLAALLPVVAWDFYVVWYSWYDIKTHISMAASALKGESFAIRIMNRYSTTMKRTKHSTIYGCLLLATVCWLYGIFVAPLISGGWAVLLCLILGAPLFLHFGIRLGRLKKRVCPISGKMLLTAVCVVVFVPLIFVFIVYGSDTGLDSMSTWNVVAYRCFCLLVLALPLSALVWMVIWALKALMHDDKRVMNTLATGCCVFVFLPIGSILPILAVYDESTSWRVERCVAVVVASVMISVSIGSVMLNMNLLSIEAERAAKQGIYRLRNALREIRTVIHPNLGRLMVDQHEKLGPANFRAWLRSHGNKSSTDILSAVTSVKMIEQTTDKEPMFGLYKDEVTKSAQVLTLEELNILQEADDHRQHLHELYDQHAQADTDESKKAIQLKAAATHEQRVATEAKLHAGEGSIPHAAVGRMMTSGVTKQAGIEELPHPEHVNVNGDDEEGKCSRALTASQHQCAQYCKCFSCCLLDEDRIRKTLDYPKATNAAPGLSQPELDALLSRPETRDEMLFRMFDYYAKGAAMMSPSQFFHFTRDAKLEGTGVISRATREGTVLWEVHNIYDKVTRFSVLHWAKPLLAKAFAAWFDEGTCKDSSSTLQLSQSNRSGYQVATANSSFSSTGIRESDGLGTSFSIDGVECELEGRTIRDLKVVQSSAKVHNVKLDRRIAIEELVQRNHLNFIGFRRALAAIAVSKYAERDYTGDQWEDNIVGELRETPSGQNVEFAVFDEDDLEVRRKEHARSNWGLVRKASVLTSGPGIMAGQGSSCFELFFRHNLMRNVKISPKADLRARLTTHTGLLEAVTAVPMAYASSDSDSDSDVEGSTLVDYDGEEFLAEAVTVPAWSKPFERVIKLMPGAQDGLEAAAEADKLEAESDASDLKMLLSDTTMLYDVIPAWEEVALVIEETLDRNSVCVTSTLAIETSDLVAKILDISADMLPPHHIVQHSHRAWHAEFSTAEAQRQAIAASGMKVGDNGAVVTIVPDGEEELKVHWGQWTNWWVLITLFAEFGSMLSVCFDDSFGWFESSSDADTLQDIASGFGFTIPSHGELFPYFFYSCVGIACTYPLLGSYALYLLETSEGLHEDDLCTKAGFFQVLLGLLGGALYFPVMKQLVLAFSCSDSGYHVLDTSLQCWKNEHIVYLMVSTVSLLLYYPLSSFIFPQLQFADKSLDIKFSPTFLIIFAQAKLLLSGIDVFFHKSPYALCITALIIYVVLVALNVSLEPCLISWIDHIRTLSFMLCVVSQASSLILVATGDVTIAVSVLATSWGILLLLALIGRLYGFNMHTVISQNCFNVQNQRDPSAATGPESPDGECSTVQPTPDDKTQFTPNEEQHEVKSASSERECCATWPAAAATPCPAGTHAVPKGITSVVLEAQTSETT